MLITQSDLASVPLRKSFSESSATLLRNAATSFKATRTYDIFISHSYSDADEILKLSTYLECRGFSTYVDWLRDRELDRSKVNSETAATLRSRMKCCRSLIYVASENATVSTWMPWELGYFDALKGRVAILPIVARSDSLARLPAFVPVSVSLFLEVSPLALILDDVVNVHSAISP